MKKLKPIIEKYGSDKSLSGYDYYYERLFSPFIGSGITYLEIGLGTLIIICIVLSVFILIIKIGSGIII